jgi:hypothetical protein
MFHDRQWHKQPRADMPKVYDAIWQDGFWKGIGVALAAAVALWLLV